MWVCLGFPWFGSSGLPVPGYGKFSTIISSDTFLIHSFSPLHLERILCVNWHPLYYPVDLICYFNLFPFIRLSALLIRYFPLFYLPDHVFILLSFSLLFIGFLTSVFNLVNEFSIFDLFIFIVFSSILQWFAFLWTIFINSFNNLLSPFWTGGVYCTGEIFSFFLFLNWE